MDKSQLLVSLFAHMLLIVKIQLQTKPKPKPKGPQNVVKSDTEVDEPTDSENEITVKVNLLM